MYLKVAVFINFNRIRLKLFRECNLYWYVADLDLNLRHSAKTDKKMHMTDKYKKELVYEKLHENH